MSTMCSSGMSFLCGPWPLPQHMWRRICSSGMSRSAWFSASTRSCGVLAIVVDAHVGEHLPAVGQVRIVDLEVQAGVGDGLVLLVHGVGDGEQELLVGRVVLVAQPVLDGAGRDRGQEALDVQALQRGLQVGDVRRGRSAPMYVSGAVHTIGAD